MKGAHRMRWRGTRTVHPYVPELQEQLRTGHLDRREFLRTVTLLGVTSSAAYAMVGRLGSSNLGLFDAMVTVTDTGKQDQDGKPILSKSMTTGAVEKLDDATVRLHLHRPVLAMPENLYHYPCAIVHRRFDAMGADLSQHPIGTGAYTLREFVVGEKCVLAERPARDYWGPEAYLDTIKYIDHGA